MTIVMEMRGKIQACRDNVSTTYKYASGITMCKIWVLLFDVITRGIVKMHDKQKQKAQVCCKLKNREVANVLFSNMF